MFEKAWEERCDRCGGSWRVLRSAAAKSSSCSSCSASARTGVGTGLCSVLSCNNEVNIEFDLNSFLELYIAMSFLILYIKVRCNHIGFLLRNSSFRFNIFNGRGWYARCYAFNWLWSTWVCPRHACRRRWELALRGLKG